MAAHTLHQNPELIQEQQRARQGRQEPNRPQEAQRLLRAEGILALAIVFPTVGRGKARLRTMPTAAHTKADFDEALAAFTRVGKQLGLI